MLENLRAMAVFASVVRHASFSGAAKELGITTSAVSQQIRTLELDLGVTLLHRSTRKLSLTEAGDSLYKSAINMVRAAEEGRDSVSQFRDELLGNLRIATTPKLASEHILPALSLWLDKHSDLSLRLLTVNDTVDMIDGRVDLFINFALPDGEMGVPLVKVPQVLVASPAYLSKLSGSDGNDYSLIGIGEGQTSDELLVALSGRLLRPSLRFSTNDLALGLAMASKGYGVLQTNLLDAKPLLDGGQLVVVPSPNALPTLVLYAKTLTKDRQPAKVWRCLEVLTEYFAKQVGGL